MCEDSLGSVSLFFQMLEKGNDQFFDKVQSGEYIGPLHRDDLWHILSMMTIQRATKQIRSENALKRGAGAVKPASQFAFGKSHNSLQLVDAARVIPTAEWDAYMTEMLEKLSLELREIAVLRLAGYIHSQVKDIVAGSMRSVERRLQLLRVTWKEMNGDI